MIVSEGYSLKREFRIGHVHAMLTFARSRVALAQYKGNALGRRERIRSRISSSPVRRGCINHRLARGRG